MQIAGQQRIAAPREAVWAALHDAEMLRRCIPGCQSAEFKSDSRLAIAVKLSFGIFSRVFKGRLMLGDRRPPEFFRISGEGKGGAAGASKWSVDLNLVDDAGQTRLDYAATAQLDGKLAQLGTFVIEPPARKMAGRLSRAQAANAVRATTCRTAAGSAR